LGTEGEHTTICWEREESGREEREKKAEMRNSGKEENSRAAPLTAFLLWIIVEVGVFTEVTFPWAILVTVGTVFTAS